MDLSGEAEGWRGLADEVGRELVVWREAHPRATLVVGSVTAVREPDGTTGARAVDLASFSRRSDATTFTRQATVELARRGAEHAAVVVGVMDGASWLQGFLDHHCPDAVRIQDVPHAVEHLTTAAHAAFGAGPPEATTWLDDQAHHLKHAGPASVLAALRQLPAEQARDPVAAHAARDATLGYLEARRAQHSTPQPKTVVNGRPAASHPWNRPGRFSRRPAPTNF